jgi:hypothetical protein
MLWVRIHLKSTRLKGPIKKNSTLAALSLFPEQEDKNMLRIFGKIILRRICGPIKENDIWRSRYSHGTVKS